MGRKQTPTHCCSAVTALGWPHTNRPLGQETSLQPNCVPHLQHHPCSPPHLCLPSLVTRPGFMSTHQERLLPATLHCTPPQDSESSGGPNAGHGKKVYSCLSVEFPADGVPRWSGPCEATAQMSSHHQGVKIPEEVKCSFILRTGKVL